MRTNIDIDEKLLRQAMKESGAKTKKAAVHEGLRELVRVARMRHAFSKIRGSGWEGDLDEMRQNRFPEWTDRP